MTYDDYLAEYLNHLKAAGFAKATIVQKRIYIGRLLKYLAGEGVSDITAVTRQRMDEFFHYIKTGFKSLRGKPLTPKSYLNNITDVTHFFRWLEQTNRILVNPVPDPPRIPRSARLPAVLTETETIRLLESCPATTPIGIRDRAILELFYSTGIRRGEMVRLNLADYLPELRELRINEGKGKKDRIVPVGDYAAGYIKLYLKAIRPWMAAPDEPALFVGAKTGGRLLQSAVGTVVRRAMVKSGIPKKVFPHMLRHSMATHLLRNGADLRHIQAILGHSSIESTTVYTHLTIQDLSRALEKAHPHGKRKTAKDGAAD
jgi:integrase/recombinase XerD